MSPTPEDLEERLRAATEDPRDFDDQPAAFRLLTRNAATIEPQLVDWLWQGWLPFGMLCLYAGYGGIGKSTIALWIVSQCSIGGKMPDGQPAPLLNTLIFASEDSPSHTIIPRLMAMGADLNRIEIVDGAGYNSEDPNWVQLREHIAVIEQAVTDHDIGLIVIDPVSSFIGDANSDRESDVRAALTPLVAMAERTGCAVLMIRHVSKAGDGSRAASRILGSTAWHDMPRTVWMLANAPDEHQPEKREDGARDVVRVLGVVKSNLAFKPQARMLTQPVDGPLRWHPKGSEVTIDECFYQPSERGAKSRDAESWLTERLAGGAEPQGSIERAAKDAGISKATLTRAKAALNIKSTKERSTNGGWVWRLLVGKIEGAHILAPSQDANTFDNGEAIEDAHMNTLNPFPESCGKSAHPDLDGDDNSGIEGIEASQLEHVHLLSTFDSSIAKPLTPTGTEGGDDGYEF